MDGDEFFDVFKWEILGDAAFEDVQGFWEPLWALRGYLRQPELSEIDRQELAERALRELQREGLLYFFRVPLNANPGDAADDESLRLTPEEFDETLSSDWWRGAGDLPPNHPNVWMWATERGLQLAKDPPPEVEKYWHRDP